MTRVMPGGMLALAMFGPLAFGTLWIALIALIPIVLIILVVYSLWKLRKPEGWEQQ